MASTYHSSAFADEYDSDYSTGYETCVKKQPRRETRRKPTNTKRETRGRLTDAELLVLPPFGYDLPSRNRFEKAFVDVIRMRRLEFLIFNKVVVGESKQVVKPVTPAKLHLFSPKDMRRERREGNKKTEVCRVLHDAFTPAAYASLSSARPAACAVGGMSTRPAACAEGGMSPRPAARAAGGVSSHSRPAAIAAGGVSPHPRPAAIAAGGVSPMSIAAVEMQTYCETTGSVPWTAGFFPAYAVGGVDQLMDNLAHSDVASQWSVASFTSTDRSSDSNEAAADAVAHHVMSPRRTREQSQDADVAVVSTSDELEQDDDEKYAHEQPTHEQPRANETEYAALQRTVAALQHTLLRMSQGQQVAAQQMQHDFTLKLQHAQTSFTQQLSAVQVSKDLITPLGLEQPSG